MAKNSFNQTVMLMGYLAGLQIALHRGDKVPTAFRYNNEVQLAPLPEWDNETYPYAIITHAGSFWTGQPYLLMCFDSELKYKEITIDENVYHRLFWDKNPEKMKYPIYFRYNDGVWGAQTETSWELINMQINDQIYHDLIWSSEDIYDVDGVKEPFKSVKPTPVYGY